MRVFTKSDTRCRKNIQTVHRGFVHAGGLHPADKHRKRSPATSWIRGPEHLPDSRRNLRTWHQRMRQAREHPPTFSQIPHDQACTQLPWDSDFLEPPGGLSICPLSVLLYGRSWTGHPPLDNFRPAALCSHALTRCATSLYFFTITSAASTSLRSPQVVRMSSA
ncbi:hypothetical protein CENSYa_1406 [Cenarchaeum symbiosum A]|uniref:Uncharacterized protein n=1 Tax=Cenarchaeum symbiosum (strain A) TaxID=414004 RepID=A0RXG1_CENSY|nr:hypothetical protein CENSYa_1406 [Cenarchaeum symbiosum A]